MTTETTCNHDHKNDEGNKITYKVTYGPVNIEKLTPEMQEKLKELSTKIFSDSRGAITEIKDLMVANPDVMQLRNFLGAAYRQCGEMRKFTELVVESFKKFPDYLFAKCQYAHLCMEQGRLDQIPVIFNGKFDIKLLYPDREVFHANEVMTMAQCMARYHNMRANYKQAQVYQSVIKKLQDNNPNVQ